MGPVLILAPLFSLVVKLAGTSGDLLEEVEGMGCTMSGGLVIGSTGMVKGRSRCFWVGVSLSPVGNWVAWSSLCLVSLPVVCESSAESSVFGHWFNL